MAILEKDLVKIVKKQLNIKYSVFEEVGFLNRSIDMVLVKKKSVLITVEFKIKDWRKAVTQIEGHQIAADYSYLCMPQKTVSNDLKNLLENRGIGLWLYDFTNNRLYEEMRAKKSQLQWEFHKKSLMTRLSLREAI